MLEQKFTRVNFQTDPLPLLWKTFVYGIIYLKMGDITIKIPQKINRTFNIDSRKSADELLRDLERRTMTNGKSVVKKLPADKKQKDFSELSALMESYRTNPDKETLYAIKTAEKWRKRWDR